MIGWERKLPSISFFFFFICFDINWEGGYICWMVLDYFFFSVKKLRFLGSSFVACAGIV